jgi:hypothetical protein
MPFMSGPSSQKMIFAFDHFDEFCAPQGIHLNLSKSMILSTLDPTTKHDTPHCPSTSSFQAP